MSKIFIFRDKQHQFIIEMINLDRYIFLNVNTRYINCYNDNIDGIHDIFIYGFDNERKVLYARDFFVRGKYKSEEIPYVEFRNAFDNMECLLEDDYLGAVSLWKYEKKDERIDLEHIREGILDYLNSRNTVVASVLTDLEQGAVFGIDLYDTVTNYIDNIVIIKKYSIDLKIINIILSHKKIMKYRIQKLSEVYKYDFIKILDDYSNLVEKAQRLMNLSIKFDMTLDESTLDKIKKLLIELKDEEIIILEKFVLELGVLIEYEGNMLER